MLLKALFLSHLLSSCNNGKQPNSLSSKTKNHPFTFPWYKDESKKRSFQTDATVPILYTFPRIGERNDQTDTAMSINPVLSTKGISLFFFISYRFPFVQDNNKVHRRLWLMFLIMLYSEVSK